jgi:hypothetical protein
MTLCLLLGMHHTARAHLLLVLLPHLVQLLVLLQELLLEAGHGLVVGTTLRVGMPSTWRLGLRHHILLLCLVLLLC